MRGAKLRDTDYASLDWEGRKHPSALLLRLSEIESWMCLKQI